MPLPIFQQPWRQAGAGLGAYQAPTVPIFAPPPTPYTPWAPGAPGGGGTVAPGTGGGGASDGDGTNTNPQTGSGTSYETYDDFKAQLPKWAQDMLASVGGAMKYTPGGLLTGAVDAGATALGKPLAGLAPIKSVPTTTWDASGSGYDTGADPDYANVERMAKGQPAPNPLATPPNPYRVQNGYIDGMAGGANQAPPSPFEQFLQGAQGLRQWQGNPAATWPVPDVTRSVLDTFNTAADGGNEDWRNAAGQEDTSGYTFSDGWWKDDDSDTYYQ